MKGISVAELGDKLTAASAAHGWSVQPDHAISEDGRRVVSRRVKWDVAGRCESPIPIELYARGGTSVTGEAKKSLEVTLYTRCRRCGWCLKKKRHEWTGYAIRETMAAPRTWLGTLTLTPDNHYRAVARARQRFSDFDAMTKERQFAALAGYMGDYVTLWLKRVRENSKSPIRYLLVAERHTEKLDGFPHYHILLHEQNSFMPVRQKVLTAAWQWGFSSFTLVDDPLKASYPCKYLLKDTATRVRASFRYGRQDYVSQIHSVEDT